MPALSVTLVNVPFRLLWKRMPRWTFGWVVMLRMFVAMYRSSHPREIDLGQRTHRFPLARRHGCVQPQLFLMQSGNHRGRAHAVQKRDAKQGAGRGSQGFGIVGADAAFEKNCAGSSEGFGGPQNATTCSTTGRRPASASAE